MSRRVYLLGIGLALVALALAVTDWALSLQPGVTEANVRRIRLGMTLEQVEAILGPPTKAEDYGLVKCEWAIPGADGGHVIIRFVDGKAARPPYEDRATSPVKINPSRGPSCTLRPCDYRFPRATPTLFDRLRGLLGW
jgi:hypothetical protein